MDHQHRGNHPPDGEIAEPDPSTPPARPGRRRRRSERGAALVEAAYVTPIFFLLVFGIIEFGLGMRSYLGLSNAVRDGAREASTVADDLDADFNILLRTNNAISAIPDEDINRIVVFHASGPDGQPTAGCKAGTPSSTAGQECNVYTPADFALTAVDFGCIASPPSPDIHWCPTTRKVRASDPPDWIGVWIEIEHDWVTGLFGNAITMTDSVVMRIEPRQQ